MKSIQEIANDKIQSMVDDGSIEKAIEKGVEAAIDEAIEKQFRVFGQITKQIEKAFEEGLALNVGDLPFETYNQQMLVAVKTKLGNLFAGQASEKFMSEIDKVLEPAPKEISAEDFVSKIVELWREELDEDELDDYARVEIEEPSWSHDGKSMGLSMWKQTRNSFSGHKGSADVNVFISNGKIRINHKHAYNPTCFNAVDAYIFKAYAAGTTITGLKEFDPDQCDLSLKDNY